MRLILRWHLAQLRAASRRVRRGTSEEALHDLRVATRKLRGSLGAYRRLLPGAIVRHSRRQLAAAMAATTRVRDTEVSRLLLSRIEEPSAARARAWLGTRWQERERRARKQATRRLARKLPAVARRLRKALAHHEAPVVDSGPGVFLEEAQTTLATASLRLELSFASARAGGGEAALHQARLAAKRLRYLLEPLAHARPTLRRLMSQLEHLQTVLGELRDERMLERRLRKEARHAPPAMKTEILRLAAAAARDRERIASLSRTLLLEPVAPIELRPRPPRTSR